MIRNSIGILSFFALFFLGIAAVAQDSGLDILTLGPGTQALGLNEAVTTELLGASSLYSNPANLAMENSSALNADYTLWIGDLTHTHAGINLRKNNRALAFGFLTSQTDEIPLRGNQPGPPDGSFNISTLSLSGGYAYQLGPLALGATVQYLREEYYIYNASGYAANLGVAGQLWDNRIRVGASLLNLGKMSELRNQSTKLPLTLRTGYSAKLFTFSPPGNEDLPISVALKNDVIFPLQESRQTTQGNSSQQIYTNVAVEISVAEIIALRTGYKTGDTVRPWSAGLGLDTEAISANYAIIPFETGFGTVHSLGLSYRF
ncbi:PorV/PorQ family protein [Fodinibius sp.]|uniref:PorV/PorQ family protein n=1 Tax=Fodinibius sp. TaxID=1872440 RepID=UPI002ACE49E2|nr:PorV/PorQ family protein [Fodinibius sp.]MDZ7659215.1 PorV/PorQ family protein [Fodinibius sp.]